MTQGTLYLVATPIGNLEDITLRALRVLKEVDLIACEDTRHTAGLLAHFGIHTPRESFHEHNEERRARALIHQMKAGKSIALVSDAGMPLISDPGFPLVSECVREGIPVIPVPGPSAILTALSASGLPSDSFFFGGFLPPRKTQRRARLQELAALPGTLVFYEAPHRLIAALEDMVEVLGPRRACLARELTKLHEEWLHGTPAEILESVRSRSRILGEITLVIDRGRPGPEPAQSNLSIGEQLREMEGSGLTSKEALRIIARQMGISRRDAYQRWLHEKADAENG